jgi:CDP-diglyceride synthetase
MNELSRKLTVTITVAQEKYVSWYVDVLIYIVVLNLFDEYAEAVRIDSFTISILTALLLKLMLVLIGRVEHRVHHYFAEKEGAFYRVLGIVVTFAILILGKLLILEVVNWVFGDRVELGHFVEVLVLILTMIIARELANWVYRKLGPPAETEMAHGELSSDRNESVTRQ